MPIYEYLCPSCNRVFSFFLRNPAEKKEPICPTCGRRDMRKQVSRFAVTGAQRKSVSAGTQNPGEDGAGDEPLEDPRVEREMMKLMSETEHIDENDPRQLGRLMRRMTDITGEPVEPEMEEAMRRLEAGDDPEKIEEELGEVLGEDDDMGGAGGAAPSYDDGLYDL